jgi:intracellular sulfur oxidation DsrE/DsrF family protein
MYLPIQTKKNMRKLSLLLLASMSFLFASAQTLNPDSLLNARRMYRDSSLRAMYSADSLKVAKEFSEKVKEDSMYARAIYPLLNGGMNSGVIPVADPTKIPDPNIDYKILFELTGNNPDSSIKDINNGLAEIARVINLHIASGVPVKRIMPIIVVHAAALHALKNNEAFQKKYKIDNPNIKLIDDLKKIGGKFIVCGQAMEFFDVKKEELLPGIKISLTAQTVITQYQLKGYVLRQLW